MKPIFLCLFVCILFHQCTKNKDSVLHYSLVGSGDTTLVFVHGWGINGSYWKSQESFFSPNYQVLSVDLQGHGQSLKRDTAITVEKYADDLTELLLKLDLKNIILVGHSMSGNINLHVYNNMKNKVIGFIGIDNLQSVGRTPEEEETKQISQFFNEFRNNYTMIARQYALGSLFVPETDTIVKSRVVNDIIALDSTFSVATLASLTKQFAAEQTILPEFEIPLLLIVADGSLQDESSLKKFCGKGYKVWTYQGAGHYPMIEIPERFNALLNDAIKSLRADP